MCFTVLRGILNMLSGNALASCVSAVWTPWEEPWGCSLRPSDVLVNGSRSAGMSSTYCHPARWLLADLAQIVWNLFVRAFSMLTNVEAFRSSSSFLKWCPFSEGQSFTFSLWVLAKNSQDLVGLMTFVFFSILAAFNRIAWLMQMKMRFLDAHLKKHALIM